MVPRNCFAAVLMVTGLLPEFVAGISSLQIVGNGGAAVCPGDRVVLLCISSNLSTYVRWDAGPSQEKTYVTTDAVNQTATITSLNANGAIVSYNYILLRSSGPMVTTLTIPSVLAKTSVQCTDSINSTTITMAAPPTVPVVTLTSCGLNAVTLQWSASLSDGGSNLTNYTLTSSPPTPNCNGSCAVGPTSRQYTFSGLQPGVPYTLGVSGTNCGGTQQGAQDNISVTIPNSQLPFVCPVFDAATSKLIQLSSTWYPLRINNNSLLCGPVGGGYNITYAGSDQTDVYSIPATNCSSNCSHLLIVGTRNSSQYNVSVAGFGVLSTIQTIVSTNNILKVEIVDWAQPVTINCTFLPGLVGTSGCVVTFGTSPDHLPYTSISSQSGGSGQSVSVQLTINGAPIDPSTTVYYYKASLWGSPQCASVVGQIGQWTGCSLSALGGGAALTPHCTALCAHWTTGLSIANGCVCLTGVVTGAQATYICDDGYMLEGGTRECMGDGAWSGTSSPTCSKTNTSSITPAGSAVQSSPTVIIIAVVCGCGLAFILVLGVVVAMVIYKKHVCNKEGQRYTTTNKQKTLAVKPDALPLQTSEHQDAPYSLKYADVITVRVASGGGVVTKTSAPTGDVTYSTLKDVGVEYDKGRTVINV